MKKLRIYLASSWRNRHYEKVLGMLREAGHEVYDFKNPAPEDRGFSWSDVGLKTTEAAFGIGEAAVDLSELETALAHPRAQSSYLSDFMAIKSANVLVLLLPCGKSAHWELGAAAALGKVTVVCTPPGEGLQPELMYMASHLCSHDQLLTRLASVTRGGLQ